jgi:SSS family solute:Na+ symporter
MKDSRCHEILASIKEKIAGDRAHLNLSINFLPVHNDSTAMPEELGWSRFVESLKSSQNLWFTPTGSHIVYRLSQADMLSCVKMVRGDFRQIWLSAEPKIEQRERQRDELCLAYGEIEDVLLEFGMSASVRT